MIPAKFQFIWPSGYREEDFLEINQSETRISVAAMLDNGSARNKQSLERTCHRCFLLSFGSFGQVVSEKIFFYQPIRNMNYLCRPCF
jgi:hypothetical protein